MANKELIKLKNQTVKAIRRYLEYGIGHLPDAVGELSVDQKIFLHLMGIEKFFRNESTAAMVVRREKIMKAAPNDLLGGE